MRTLRSAIGTGLDPPCWMVGHSLETLSLRMHTAARNAEAVANFLALHPRVRRVHALNLLREGDPAAAVHARQATGAGSTFGIEIEGGITEAFRVLNALYIFKLAVSLGGTESPSSAIPPRPPIRACRPRCARRPG